MFLLPFVYGVNLDCRFHFRGNIIYNSGFSHMWNSMAKSAAPKTFEDAMAKLETIVQAMQNNELPLEEALSAYKEGCQLVQFCQKKLTAVEEQLKMFDGNDLTDLPVECLPDQGKTQ